MASQSSLFDQVNSELWTYITGNRGGLGLVVVCQQVGFLFLKVSSAVCLLPLAG